MKSKTFIILGSVLIGVIALFLSRQFTNGGKADPDFRWTSRNPNDSLVQVTTGKTVIVPVEFEAGAGVSEMSFEIKDESLREKGIFLENTVVPVKNGKASSKVIFKLQPEAGIKAGRYYLRIIARDTATGKVVREGELPFGVDMLDLIWKCSC
jgi:hypothetical protein